tara:strand:- start:132 stop:584 length:453 start_codon:yes stop_codon:yes gene_type:complete
LNYLLSLEKKYLVIIILFIISLAIFVFVIKTIETNYLNNQITKFDTSDSDITKPKFTINSEDQKISISANEGNFLNNNEILLKNDVVFESNKFTIYSDDVIFNKNDQTAASKVKSKFVSENTSILSDGFEIVDNGNQIKFNGKTTINLND